MPTRPKFSSAAAPVERPLPLWILYPLFFAVLYVAHWKLLRLPFFWDEAGYYIPAALDFFRTGSLIPTSTITNAHPPLPSILLATWWHIGGYVISGTRTFVVMFAAAALLGVFRLGRLLAGTPVAVAATLLTALYPVWFVQSTLVHADIFAAAFTLWALSFYFEYLLEPAATHLLIPIAALFTLAALSKETAIVTPAVLALWALTGFFTGRAQPRLLLSLAFPVVPLAAWYAYHHHLTGFVFGNPEFLRYNATANLTPVRILLSLWHRLSHLTFHMGLYVPALCTLAVVFIPRPARAPEAPLLRRTVLIPLAFIVFGNALAFSVLGGALLTRYLLPLYPLLLLAAIGFWRQRLPQWPLLTVLSAAGFLTALFVNPPYPFAPEDNLTYRDFVLLHQQAAQLLALRYPAATVLTAWPATTELIHPDLGYVRTPLKIAAINDFSLQSLQAAAQDPGAYDTALIFSTKWVPPAGRLNLAARNRAADTRLYDFHDDLSPQQAALLLHGDIVWERHQNGEWAAILRFPRSNEARLGAQARPF